MIDPANDSLSQQKIKLQQKTDKIAEIEKITAAENNLNSQMAELEQAIHFFESKLPGENEIHKVLEQVTLIAQKQGLLPKTIRTLKRKPNSGYIEQPLKMQLQGDYDSFYSFLLEMEQLPRIIKVRELKLKKTAKTEGQITADFVLSVFFLG
jgi:type IV pilus assembly protein PilO